jgi:hypothetical protein
MARRRLPPLGTLLAVVALLVAPLRSTVACDMAPEVHAVDAHHGPPASATEAMDHSAHAGHLMAEPIDSDAPAPDHPASVPMPCDDWASCAMIALPQVAQVRALASIPATTAPRITLAAAPDAPALTVEPPPPRG